MSHWCVRWSWDDCWVCHVGIWEDHARLENRHTGRALVRVQEGAVCTGPFRHWDSHSRVGRGGRKSPLASSSLGHLYPPCGAPGTHVIPLVAGQLAGKVARCTHNTELQDTEDEQQAGMCQSKALETEGMGMS